MRILSHTQDDCFGEFPGYPTDKKQTMISIRAMLIPTENDILWIFHLTNKK